MNDHIAFSVAPQWLWISYVTGILILLAIDIAVSQRSGHKPSTRTALLESAMWIGIALSFNLWFGFRYGSNLGIEFLTGYIIEKSLSVDNLFIILLVFKSFHIQAKYQHRILFYGILGAIVMRGVLIIVGAELIRHFAWILYVFGGILLATAIKLFFESDKEIELSESWSIRLLRRIFPITDKLNGDRFFIIEKGVRKATPLLVALVVIEATDLVFAMDSIPAVFAVTKDPFVAFASNIFAVLGLRALYFVLAEWVAELRYLKPALALVLAFIGFKMVAHDFVEIPSSVSLVVVVAILTIAAIASVIAARRQESKH